MCFLISDFVSDEESNCVQSRMLSLHLSLYIFLLMSQWSWMCQPGVKGLTMVGNWFDVRRKCPQVRYLEETFKFKFKLVHPVTYLLISSFGCESKESAKSTCTLGNFL